MTTDAPAVEHVEKLRPAIDDATKYVSKVYITYLLASIYIAVAIASTTDEQLLLETNIALPLLAVGLPIRGFYVIVSFTVLLLHLYLLIQIYLLSVKLVDFEDALQSVQPLRDRQRQRSLLWPFVITPLSIRANDSPLIRSVLWLIVGVTVILMPPLILEFGQLRFLPYHNVPITSWHRMVLCSDVALLWVLWTFILQRQPTGAKRPSSKASKILNRLQMNTARLISGILVVFAMVVATIPGEFLDDTTHLLDNFKNTLHRNLIVRTSTLVREAPAPQLVAVFVQQGKLLDDAWQKHAKGIDLRERDLRGADFSNSSFYNADFRGAKLDFAKLESSNFQGAQFEPADRPDGIKVSSSLRGANLFGADLRHATLNQAMLQGADLSAAKMQGASLVGADLSGVRQSRVDDDFFGTELGSVILRGAVLMNAHLEAADLRGADLQGADLTFADLQGANLSKADLTGAILLAAKIQRADLRAAILDLSYLEEIKTGPLTSKDDQEATTQIDRPSQLHIHNAFYTDDFANAAGVFKSLKEAQYFETLVSFLVDLGCTKSFIAKSLVLRSAYFLAIEKELPDLALSRTHFASTLARAMLESEEKRKCNGVTDLSRSFHEGLERVARARRAKID